MAKVAFLGTGLMGSGMIEALLRRGEEVTAWNRTLERARPLEKLGAALAASPAEAVRGAERVHLLLSDDAAVDGVLEQARPGLAREAFVVDHTTVSPAGTVARYRRCAEQGVTFLHAPVFMTPQNCRESTGLMLASGPGDRFERAEPFLRTMTGKVWYLGEREDLGAAYKLFGNAVILTLAGALSDVYQLAAQLGIKATDAHQLFGNFNARATIDHRGKNMAEGNFQPAFELVMARKDVRLMLEIAGDAPLTLLPALAARMDEVIAQGKGHLDAGVIGHDRRR
jgi:3-hydroxyisobutyrate dehydrogenase-like beta-hydroxyacid dehydrogenase